MSELDAAKAALRVKSTVFDAEIEALIAACKADLRLAGINIREEQPAEGEEPPAGDPLILRAVILYCKANFGYTEDSERFTRAYNHLKCALALAGDYRV